MTTQDAALVYTAALNPFVTLPQGTKLVGLTDEAVFNGVAATLASAKRRVAETGKGESIDLNYSYDGHDRWYRIRLEPLAGNGSTAGILAASIDITRQKTAEEHLRLALLELAHRSKNLLAVVLSLARQSADDSRDLEDFRGRFLGRIRALALAHDVLTEEAWRGATVFSLVRSQLGAFSDNALDQLHITGHNAFLKPNARAVCRARAARADRAIDPPRCAGASGRPRRRRERVEDDEDATPVLRLGGARALPARPAREGTTEFGQALLEEIVPAALSGARSSRQPRRRAVSTNSASHPPSFSDGSRLDPPASRRDAQKNRPARVPAGF